MNNSLDRLYKLLPVVYRQRDAEQGYPLRALLQVISEQVNVVEEDISQLYENWFIETCKDWVVPYIGDLIGYQPVHEAGEPGDVTTQQGRLRNKILIPRREVANTIRYRRRKGTLALLELLANDVAGWPARAVEFYKLLGWTQALNHLRLYRGNIVDLRLGDSLDRINGPFDQLAHTIDVRRINSHRTYGRYNISSVGIFVWRLRVYSVTQTPAYCLEEVSPHCYTFSVLGNDTPLFTKPQSEEEPTDIAGELNLPIPIKRWALEKHKGDYYGDNKSLQIWVGNTQNDTLQLISPEKIIVADMSNWQYMPHKGYVAVDPVLGRIAFPPLELPKGGVWVSYFYGFSDEIGGGEYERSLSQPSDTKIYRVGEQERLKRIVEALSDWKSDKPKHAVIEITDSGVYVEQINVEFKKNQDLKVSTDNRKSLQIRAADRKRPVIRLLDWRTNQPDSLTISGETGCHFVLDGLLVTGRGIHVSGNLATVEIRHTTLVPGWLLNCNCEPLRPVEPSLELFNTDAKVTIKHSIIGSIQVNQDEVKADPTQIYIYDSVLDATGPEQEALGAPDCSLAHAVLTIIRSTVFGEIQTHAIDLAENCIFYGFVKVARRQRGCMRFCYVKPDSRTPRRYNCQPDLVDKSIIDRFERGIIKSEEERDREQTHDRLRVRPRFNSMRYGTPNYCQLEHACAEEIKRGADDESEMGVFHNLFQPQRAANLRARLEKYTPAGMDAGIIYAS